MILNKTFLTLVYKIILDKESNWNLDFPLLDWLKEVFCLKTSFDAFKRTFFVIPKLRARKKHSALKWSNEILELCSAELINVFSFFVILTPSIFFNLFHKLAEQFYSLKSLCRSIFYGGMGSILSNFSAQHKVQIR